jgi:hypothetical protein
LGSRNRSKVLQWIKPIGLLQKGNSDPFTASAIPITPEINELVQLSSHFYVFWAWAVSVSLLFKAKADRAWIESARARIQGKDDMHVMLSAGAYIKAHLFDQSHNPEGRERLIVRGLMHKTQVLTQLRKDLAHGAGAKLETILGLVALEFGTGNFEAAIWHHYAAKKLISSLANPENKTTTNDEQKEPIFAVAEVWTAAAALQKATPCGMVDWEGERNTPTASACQLPAPSPLLFLYDLEWLALHHGIHLTLQPVFKQIQKTTLYLGQLHKLDDEVEIFTTVSYLDTKSATLRAKLLEIWVDFDNTRRLLNERTRTLDDLLFSATCLSALLFINIIFMYKSNKSTDSPSAGATATNPINTDNILNVFNLPNPIRTNNHASPTTQPTPPPPPARPPPLPKALLPHSVNRKTLQRLHEDLQQIQEILQHQSQLHTAALQFADPELLLWLTFIRTLTETLEDDSTSSASSPSPSPSPTSTSTTTTNPNPTYGLQQSESPVVLYDYNFSFSQSYSGYALNLPLHSTQEAKLIFRQFLYHDDLMDMYLNRILTQLSYRSW